MGLRVGGAVRGTEGGGGEGGRFDSAVQFLPGGTGCELRAEQGVQGVWLCASSGRQLFLITNALTPSHFPLHRRVTAPRGGGLDDEAKPRENLHSQRDRHELRHLAHVELRHHGSEHGRQDDVPAVRGAVRGAGADGLLRAGVARHDRRDRQGVQSGRERG